MDYTIIKSKRHTISIQVKCGGAVVVRAPLTMSDKIINEFVLKHADWIKNKQELLKNAHSIEDFDKNQIKDLKETLQQIIIPLVDYYSKKMGVSPKRISINSAKTRFGSCSSKGNINFSCRLALFPHEAIEYVCVHELAHLIEMNHSKRFWAIVSNELPDYKARRELFKKG